AGYKSIIACGNADRQKKICENFSAQGVNLIATDEPKDYKDCFATTFFLNHGFILHDDKLVVLGTFDLYVAGVKEKRIKKRRNETFSAPEVGDFAVHEDYGIGLIRGTQRITTTESVKDYIAIEYAEGDILYIPVEDMDKLTKYLGKEGSPQLNKLGNNEFEKIKQRVRESISRMSINLKKLYKERAEQKGFRFSEDNDLTREFEEAFPYELTEDQAQSLAEIKKDMQSDRIMDRLLLGDVGFGKTEVALRAAFKAVFDMKQVAIVAPTTILTEQHYQTVEERFKDFGVRAGLLNRFQKPAKVKETLKKLKDGDIDIIIGTHRIFGKDVEFRDLGLLILDEEQRFGVEHKEKLRTLKKNVDTITMSATPIPRTLHMSLTGIRDISLILTPPSARIPVQSYVIEESETLIRDAIMKELSRGGQTFILFNDVKGIYEFADKIVKLVPEAKVVVGHGQMTRDELEDNILAFYAGKYDVLVATTIIENGIDIPKANTLVVIDADKLGLFSLYQLKGRVGRSDVMAHAYFTYKPDKVLTDASYKRLGALMESTELGSGYKIAMRDLEIRGAGNVLGREQHGHLEKIGYELYSKLLKEQLGEVAKDFETELDVKLDAFIPESYVQVSSSRLDLYKALAEIKSDEDKQRVISSAAETYGPLPEEVENLIIIAELKNLCKKLEIINLKLNKSGCALTFKDLNSLSNGGVMQAVKDFSDRVKISFYTNPVVTITGEEAKEIAEFSLRFLNYAKEKAN
ncbi:MAG: transcription-repair coupling factor, partial [Clostridia bacterium]|nr:transcription-repair coupling factor [Clostridia bacterium]